MRSLILQHPGIVQIFEIGEHDGLPYFSLEYIAGESLDKKFAKETANPVQAAKMGIEIAETMQFAHDRGILHRDLKPSNILLTATGQTKVADFGLAKNVHADQQHTQTGAILGTAGYMPPEQARGDTLNPSADQYSIAALLYRVLCGRAPFAASRTVDTIMQVLVLDPVPLKQLAPEIPNDLETICLKALSKDESQRYENCQALANDLKRFVDNQPIHARPIGSFEKSWRWCKRNPRIATLATSLLVALSMIAGLATWTSVTIAKERDNVKQQKQIADENLQRAEANEKQALASQELTQQQALNIIKTMQSVLINVDKPLKADPNLADTRLEVMQAMSKTFTDLELEMHTDVKSEALPTLMSIRFNLVHIFQSLNQSELALQEIDAVYQMAKERITVREGIDAARSNLVKVCLAYAQLKERTASVPASKPLLDEAETVARDIVANPKPYLDGPGTPPEYELKYLLSSVLQSIAIYHLRQGELEAAGQIFKEASDLRNEVLDDLDTDTKFQALPEDARASFANEVRFNASRSSRGASTAMLKNGQIDEGLGQLIELQKRVESYYEQQPNDLNEQEVGKAAGSLGYNLLRVAKNEQATEYLNTSLEIAEKFAAKNPNDYDTQSWWSVSLYQKGVLLSSIDKPAAQRLFRSCVNIRKKLVDEDPTLKNETRLMLALARNGQVDDALSICQRLAKNPELQAQSLIDIAKCFSLVAFQVEEDRKSDLLKQAIDAIDKTIQPNFNDWFSLETDPDLVGLQQESRFRQLIDERKAAGTPNQN